MGFSTPSQSHRWYQGETLTSNTISENPLKRTNEKSQQSISANNKKVRRFRILNTQLTAKHHIWAKDRSVKTNSTDKKDTTLQCTFSHPNSVVYPQHFSHWIRHTARQSKDIAVIITSTADLPIPLFQFVDPWRRNAVGFFRRHLQLPVPRPALRVGRQDWHCTTGAAYHHPPRYASEILYSFNLWKCNAVLKEC